MKIEQHRNIIGNIKTMAIKKEAGNYYAIFTTIKEVEMPKAEDINPIGIDVGLHSFIATSNGTKVVKPKFVKKAEKHIVRWQKRRR